MSSVDFWLSAWQHNVEIFINLRMGFVENMGNNVLQNVLAQAANSMN